MNPRPDHKSTDHLARDIETGKVSPHRRSDVTDMTSGEKMLHGIESSIDAIEHAADILTEFAIRIGEFSDCGEIQDIALISNLLDKFMDGSDATRNTAAHVFMVGMNVALAKLVESGVIVEGEDQ